MPRVLDYESIPMPKVLRIFMGGTSLGVFEHLENNNSSSVVDMTCDCGDRGSVDVILPLDRVRKFLTSPNKPWSQFNLDPPELDFDFVANLKDGLMLEARTIGPFLSVVSEEQLMDQTYQKIKLFQKEGVGQSGDLTFICNSSLGGGSGRSVSLNHCSALKKDFPNSLICFVTSCEFIGSAVPSVIARDQIRENIASFLHELVNLENGLSQDLRFVGFRDSIPSSLPDYIFDIVGINTKEEYLRSASCLNDALSAGIPFGLDDIENVVLRNIRKSNRGVLVSTAFYDFPKAKVRRFLARSSLKLQLSRSIKNYEASEVFSLYDFSHFEKTIPELKVIDDSVHQKIRSADLDIEKFLSEIIDLIDDESRKLSANFETLFSDFTETNNLFWRKLKFEEFIARAEPTLRKIAKLKADLLEEVVTSDQIDSVKNAISDNYRDIKKIFEGRRLFNFSWGRQLDTKTKTTVSLIEKFENLCRLREEQRLKLHFLDRAEAFLEDTLEKVENLSERVDRFISTDLEPPADEFVRIPDVDGLLKNDYRIPSLVFEEIEDRWEQDNEDDLDDLVYKSFSVDLGSNELKAKNPEFAWESVGNSLDKPEIEIAIVPDFASLSRTDRFSYILKRKNFFKVCVLRMVFNISMKEILASFRTRWGSESFEVKEGDKPNANLYTYS